LEETAGAWLMANAEDKLFRDFRLFELRRIPREQEVRNQYSG